MDNSIKSNDQSFHHENENSCDEYIYMMTLKSGQEIRIRPAGPDDAAGIRQVMTWFVEKTNCSWRYKPLSLEDMVKWLAEHLVRPARQIWIAECQNQIIGYSCLSDYRAPEGYRRCAENSVYVMPQYAGQQIGQVLMQRILDQAVEAGLHRIVAAIDGANHASIRFHERFGFQTCGILPQVGWKNNQWLDLVLMLYQVPEKI